MLDHQSWVMFVGLVGLYSPIAALPSYLPVVNRLRPRDHIKLALGLFAYVSIFVLAALWIGEVLLHVLGISTAALTAAGGIALSYEGVLLMLGKHPAPVVQAAPTVHNSPPGQAEPPHQTSPSEPPEQTESTGQGDQRAWQSFLLVPVTFPLTVGGATFALVVSFSALAGGNGQRVLLTFAALGYAAVTGLTLFATGHISRRASARALDLLERVAGILLTAIAVSLLASGGTRLVVDVFHSIR